MEYYTSDSSDSDSREQKTIECGKLSLLSTEVEDHFSNIYNTKKSYQEIETIHLNHNRLIYVPDSLVAFTNLKILDVSHNSLTALPDAIVQCRHLTTLIAKNNLLTNKSLPKSFFMAAVAKGGGSGRNGDDGGSCLRELNLSGNKLQFFPEQVLELKQLRYLYLGGNQIKAIARDIWKLQKLNLLSIGGNLLTEVPDTVGSLSHLQALALSDNLIENLPPSIALLKNLKSLLLHRNKLRHLPRDIASLQNLTELSLRDNPLVDRFVQDMSLSPPSLLELAGRAIKISHLQYGPDDLPRTLCDYLGQANCCVNPKCSGVFFDNRVEHIKFVDFCGKYRVPLLQFLCSSKCVAVANKSNAAGPAPGVSGYMMKKVLLG